MNTIITIIVTVLMFALLVVCHEFGHFIVAVKSGVTVKEFSIGFGPLLYSKKTKHTTFCIRAIPLGGYCSMPEDEEDKEDEEKSSEQTALEEKEPETGYYDIHPLKRIALSAAGPIANFLLAIVLFFIIYIMSGTHATTTLKSVTDGSVAAKAGIVAGDTITEINGEATPQWEDVSRLIDNSEGNSLQVTVRKQDGSFETYELTPNYDEATDDYYIGIVSKASFNLWYAIVNSFKMVFTYIALIFEVFVGLFKGLYGMEAFSGPIGVGVAVGQYMSMGLIYLIYLAAGISVSLGFFNLLPIPALDGSKIIFSLAEWIAGKPLSRKVENTLNIIGLVVLMGFAAFVAYMDIVNYL